MRQLFYFSLVIWLCGCSLSKSQEASNMNMSVKVSRDKAISIAKNYVLKQEWSDEYQIEKEPKVELETLYKYDDGTVSWTKLKTKMGYVKVRERWAVTFSPRKNFLKNGFHLFVMVNAETGEIEDTGNYKY